MNIDRLHKYHFGLILFIIIYLIFAILNYKEFPISADEEFRYTRGKELLNFYLNSQPRQTYFEPKILPDQFYFYNLIQNVINPNFFYEWFHLQNIVFSSIIFVVFYFLLYSYTKNQYFSVFGITVLFFTPNFTGHIAFNPVDMPFAVMFLLNIYLIYLYKDIEFDFKKIVILGFSFWFLIGIRPIGFQIFLLYLLFTLFYKFNDKKYLISQFKNLTLISIISLFLLTISWPYLGVNIYKNLFYTFSSTASFDNWNRLILFDGELISKENREWHYLFTYFGLTTPIYILVLLLMSFINLKNSLKKSLIFVLFFNLLVYILINPVIYNGLRHFLYLIPIIVLISLFNLYDFLNLKINRMFKLIIILFICLNLFSTIFQMYRLFPLHYSYFNEIAGGTENNIKRFETEYWGGSYKYASEYIRDNLSKENPHDVKVYSCNMSFAVDYYSHKKFVTTNFRKEADFIICTIPEEINRNLTGKIIKEINLGNSSFVNIRENNDKILK